MSKMSPIAKTKTAQGPELPPTPQTRAPRESVFLAATVVEKRTGKAVAARIRNLSATGALIQVPGAEPLSGKISVTFRGVATMDANVVRADGRHVGIRFDGEIEPTACHKSIFSETSGVPDWFHNIVAYYKTNRRPGLG